jgi:hypothetical protein
MSIERSCCGGVGLELLAWDRVTDSAHKGNFVFLSFAFGFVSSTTISVCTKKEMQFLFFTTNS